MRVCFAGPPPRVRSGPRSRGVGAFVSRCAGAPPTIVALRTDSAVVHAGDTVRVAGFVRARRGASLRAASGTAQIALRDGPELIAQTNVALDAAGAFATTFAIPVGAGAGDYAALASADGGGGGAAIHVDRIPAGRAACRRSAARLRTHARFACGSAHVPGGAAAGNVRCA